MSPLGFPRFEEVSCYQCGSDRYTPLHHAQDDLTGKPGDFTFVRCEECGFAFQNPRVRIEDVKAYYDDEYIAHRKKRNWGPFAMLVDKALNKLDRQKMALVERYVDLREESSVLDVGCGAATFLAETARRYGSQTVGVDFIDLAHLPAYEGLEFHCGLFYESEVGVSRFDLVTMWHFLEHDYDPAASLAKAWDALKPRGLLIVEVPRLDSLSYLLYRDRWPGLQAPQHTVLYTRETLLRDVEKSGFEVVEHLPYGAYPAYFYLFAGALFKVLKGRGLDLRKILVPYFLGQLLLLPLLLFEKKLNLAMQTVACRKTD